jgi:hypothetical protein
LELLGTCEEEEEEEATFFLYSSTLPTTARGANETRTKLAGRPHRVKQRTRVSCRGGCFCCARTNAAAAAGHGWPETETHSKDLYMDMKLAFVCKLSFAALRHAATQRELSTRTNQLRLCSSPSEHASLVQCSEFTT